MEDTNVPSAEILKQAVIDLREPVLFQHLLQDSKGVYIWQLLQWNLLELTEQFGDMKLPFRVGYNAKSESPQWETQCSTKVMSLREFIQHVQSYANDNTWYYFDYKHMQEWLLNKPEIITSLDWHRFGFDKKGSDSTLWIGSKGSHTNCHQDSYGCNLIAQIHGKKQWLLFPPSASNMLQPTRVPYEESTVYSKFNFFCPTNEDEKAILEIMDKPKLITLEPGDVLLVPGGWWHYVESLDLSVSVNIWLSLDTDNHAQLKEALVKLIVSRIGKNIYRASNEVHYSLPYFMKIVENVLNECKTTENSIEYPCRKKMKSMPWIAKDLASQYPVYVKLLCELEKTELQELLQQKRKRFSVDLSELLQSDSAKISHNSNTLSSCQQLEKNIVNALCHSDVIDKVIELLLNVCKET